MEIIKAYKTTRGIFTDKMEASKKNNREKDYGSRLGDLVKYEDVKEIYLIRFENKYFELTQVNIKQLLTMPSSSQWLSLTI